MEKIRTFVPLLFYLELLCKVLIFLPLDLRACRMVIDKIAGIIDLGLVIVGLLQDLIIEELILVEVESEFKSGLTSLRQVSETNVLKVLESASVSFGDLFTDTDMIA